MLSHLKKGPDELGRKEDGGLGLGGGKATYSKAYMKHCALSCNTNTNTFTNANTNTNKRTWKYRFEWAGWRRGKATYREEAHRRLRGFFCRLGREEKASCEQLLLLHSNCCCALSSYTNINANTNTNTNTKNIRRIFLKYNHKAEQGRQCACTRVPF